MTTHLLEFTLFALVMFATPGTTFAVKSSSNTQIPGEGCGSIRLNSAESGSTNANKINNPTAAYDSPCLSPNADPPRTPMRVLKSKLAPSPSQDGVTAAAAAAATTAGGGGGTGSPPSKYYYYYYYQYSPSIVPAGPPHAHPVISAPPTKLVQSPPQTQSLPKSSLPPVPPLPPLPLDPRTILNHPSVPSPPPPPVSSPAPSVAGVNGNVTSGSVLTSSKYVCCSFLIAFLMVALL
jgi:hypothetical protein